MTKYEYENCTGEFLSHEEIFEDECVDFFGTPLRLYCLDDGIHHVPCDPYEGLWIIPYNCTAINQTAFCNITETGETEVTITYFEENSCSIRDERVS